MRGKWLRAVVAVGWAITGCGGVDSGGDPHQSDHPQSPDVSEDAGVPDMPNPEEPALEEDAGEELDAGVGARDGGARLDAGIRDAGIHDAGTRDAGTATDAGSSSHVDAGTPAPDAGVDAGAPSELPDAGAGPWPTTASKNYTQDYSLGAVQSVGIDDAYNIWLLYQNKVGVLRPGDSHPIWTQNIGQASLGFGADKLSLYSTVICGGSAGRAYVGYAATEIPALRSGIDDPEYKKGDIDVVKLNSNGTISLEEHLSQSVRYFGETQNTLGLRNTNNWNYDEDRTVLVFTKVMRGANRGDVFVGTQHGVSMIRGLVYNSHRHPVWDVNGSLRIGYNNALGIGQNGDVLIGNDWKIAILAHPANLADWDNSVINKWKLDTYVAPLNSLAEFDFWRGFTQAKSGEFYLSSYQYGLWTFAPKPTGGYTGFTAVSGLPTPNLGMAQATDDGSVFVATRDHGLWQLTPSKAWVHVEGIAGSNVRQLVYDPTVSPSMLLVLTDAGLTVLRGF